MKILKRFSLLLVLCCSLSFLLATPRTSAMWDEWIVPEEDSEAGTQCYVWQPQCQWCACQRTKCKEKVECGVSCQQACDYSYNSCVGNNNCP